MLKHKQLNRCKEKTNWIDAERKLRINSKTERNEDMQKEN